MPRDEAERLLVFLANDTLEGEERAAVEAAVEDDPGLARELAALRNIRAEMRAEAPTRLPGEFGLARLMRDIDGEARAVAAAPQPAPRGRLWRYAAVAAVALFAVQTALIWTRPEVAVELAGGGTERAEGPALTVAFRPDVRETDIRALLLAAGLVIVDGPSALGLYTLAAPGAETAEAALAALRARPDLVESAEPEE
jgi:anti-sigma factor RsiW